MVEGVIGNLLPPKLNKGDKDDKAAACNQYLASLFLGGVDLGCYKAAVDELNNNYILGKDVYPADIPTAINILTNH